MSTATLAVLCMEFSSRPPAIRRQQQLGQVVIPLPVEPGHVPDPLDPRVNRVRMLAEKPCGFLHVHVGLGYGAERLHQRALGLGIGIAERAGPGGRRRAHMAGAALHQQRANGQLGKLNDTLADAGEIESDRRLVQRLGQKRRGRMIAADADQHGRT